MPGACSAPLRVTSKRWTRERALSLLEGERLPLRIQGGSWTQPGVRRERLERCVYFLPKVLSAAKGESYRRWAVIRGQSTGLCLGYCWKTALFESEYQLHWTRYLRRGRLKRLYWAGKLPQQQELNFAADNLVRAGL